MSDDELIAVGNVLDAEGHPLVAVAVRTAHAAELSGMGAALQRVLQGFQEVNLFAVTLAQQLMQGASNAGLSSK